MDALNQAMSLHGGNGGQPRVHSLCTPNVPQAKLHSADSRVRAQAERAQQFIMNKRQEYLQNAQRTLFGNIVDNGGLSVTNQASYISNAKSFYNADGLAQNLTTFTQVRQQIVDQVFHRENPADFLPIQVGFGAFADEFLVWKSAKGLSPMSGFIGEATYSRLPTVDVKFNKETYPIEIWAHKMEYGLFEVQQALFSSENLANSGASISLIQEREKALKEAWDLMVQETAFQGNKTRSGGKLEGLFDHSAVTPDAGTVVTDLLQNLAIEDFISTIGQIVAANYLAGGNTVYPNTLVLPQSEYDAISLTDVTANNFHRETRLEMAERSLRNITGEDFQIKKSSYLNANQTTTGKERYVCYRNDSDTLDMQIPVQYTSIASNTADNFTFGQVSYGQVSGVNIYRPKLVQYFDLPLIVYYFNLEMKIVLLEGQKGLGGLFVKDQNGNRVFLRPGEVVDIPDKDGKKLIATYPKRVASFSIRKLDDVRSISLEKPKPKDVAEDVEIKTTKSKTKSKDEEEALKKLLQETTQVE